MKPNKQETSQTTLREVNGKEMTGRVVSLKSTTTAIVSVDHMVRHPKYHKAVKKNRHFAVHNELTDLKEGDIVRIQETRPISKTKHFRVVGKVQL